MKRIILSIFALCCIVMSASALKVYINPGHGGWGSGDRPNATINYAAYDTLGFFESNTNLWKCLYMRTKLQAAGASIKMSRTTNGTAEATKSLSTIASEVNNYAPSHFISVHSNAATEGTSTNYPLILFRGQTSNEKVSGSKARSQSTWDALVDINKKGFEYYTHYTSSRNCVGDNSFYGTSGNNGYLGVLKHSYPGYLTEGYFHTYQPSRHRALNPDWCCQEGLRYARGIINYHGLTKDTKGYIMGEIKDKSKSVSHSLYTYNSNTTDKYLPIHGAKIILKDSKGNVIKTNCYPYVKKMLKNQNYYTTDNNYNGIFVFENLAPGTYTYSVHKSGYKDAKGTLTVSANATTYTTIYMTAGTGTNAEDNLVTTPDVEWELNGGVVIGGTVPTSDELIESFKTAYNKFFSQSIATTREISNFLYYGNSLGCDVSKMMTSTTSGWKWLGDYITNVSNAAGVALSAEVNWRYSLTAFFTCGAAGSYNADFTTAGKSSAWGEAYQVATGTSAKLPQFITSTYTIPTPKKEGYKFLGWYNTNNTSGTKYTTLSAGFKGKLYAIWELENVDVKWELNGGSVSVTLPTKIEGSAYTLPTPTKAGYIFLGWYDSNSTSGNKLTSLSVGWKGTVYALWREAKVTWVLNGGKVYETKTTAGTVVVPTNDSLWTAFKAYYKTFYNENRADQPINMVATFMTKGYKIMTDATSEYKWLGDYILSVATAQSFTLGEDEALWRWHVDAFFQANKHESWPVSADFSTAGKPSAWGPAYQKAHGDDATGGTTTKVEVTLPSKITSTYTIPTPEKDGSTFVGWYDNANGTGTALKTLPAYYDGTVYAIWKSNEPTDVTWNLNGGSVSVTLPTKIENAYTLPTPTKTGYVFLGWYDNAAGTGNALTSLPVGYKGTIYALWREAKVTWELNGGKVYETKTTTTGGSTSSVVVPTNDSLWTAFKAYYKTFYNENRADQPINMVATFMTKGYKIMTDASSEYKWLGDYILSVATAQSFTLGEDEALWRWHVDAFFQANKHESWPVSADFSTAGKPSAWGPAYQAAKGGTTTGGTTTTTKVEVTLPSKITAAYTIPTPEKEGATFLGWYDTNNTTGNKLTVLPAYYDGTVYAIWSDGPTTAVENIERPALDINAPMYDLLGRQVDATYRGIIIQNGNKYLLR